MRVTIIPGERREVAVNDIPLKIGLDDLFRGEKKIVCAIRRISLGRGNLATDSERFGD